MNVRWLDDPKLLAPTDLDDHPELAVLALVREAVAVIDLALLAAYPHLVGDDLDSPAEHAANVVIQAALSLRSAIDAYRCILDHEDAATQ